jgi:hypothetical protein
MENRFLKDVLESKKQEIISELTQSLFNVSPDKEWGFMINGFISLELLGWHLRNMPNSSNEKVF